MAAADAVPVRGEDLNNWNGSVLTGDRTRSAQVEVVLRAQRSCGRRGREHWVGQIVRWINRQQRTGAFQPLIVRQTGQAGPPQPQARAMPFGKEKKSVGPNARLTLEGFDIQGSILNSFWSKPSLANSQSQPIKVFSIYPSHRFVTRFPTYIPFRWLRTERYTDYILLQRLCLYTLPSYDLEAIRFAVLRMPLHKHDYRLDLIKQQASSTHSLTHPYLQHNVVTHTSLADRANLSWLRAALSSINSR